MRTNKKTEDEKIFGLFSLMGVQSLNYFHIGEENLFFLKTGPQSPLKIHIGEGIYNFLKYGLEKSYFLGYISRVS